MEQCGMVTWWPQRGHILWCCGCTAWKCGATVVVHCSVVVLQHGRWKEVVLAWGPVVQNRVHTLLHDKCDGVQPIVCGEFKNVALQSCGDSGGWHGGGGGGGQRGQHADHCPKKNEKKQKKVRNLPCSGGDTGENERATGIQYLLS
jgi:hypothetical protein